MINYPKKIKLNNEKLKSSSKNLGMSLENDIDLTNKYYEEKNVAFIYKKPTPIQVVKVDYKMRSKTKINEAYYTKRSTTDYNGIFNGYYIDFDAKETKSKTSIPLSNIKSHQIKHLKNIYEQGGIAFLIINFKTLNRYFLLPYKELEKHLNSTRKSIKLEDIEKLNLEIKFSFNPRLDYLLVIKNNMDMFLK